MLSADILASAFSLPPASSQLEFVLSALPRNWDVKADTPEELLQKLRLRGWSRYLPVAGAIYSDGMSGCGIVEKTVLNGDHFPAIVNGTRERLPIAGMDFAALPG